MININSNMSSVLSQMQNTSSAENRLKNIAESKEILSGKNIEDQEKLKETCRDFESIFINQMLKQARSSIQQIGGAEERSHAREIYESMQDEELAKAMSQGKGIGLAQELYKQLSRHG